ncbi:hypothetical protein HYC85_017326 [Camellia sinensis]|uniref:Uncharacterized protein n=1 Tax=Camellia sinensis TaxID=4442 RepID=A0A7J7H5W7_CAMSI|nr:hypothetical protein HYC85_017326 [Camellia sinensis]
MAFGYSINFTSFPDFFNPSTYLLCQSCNGSPPPITTNVAGNFTTADTSPPLTASWFRSDPIGKNNRHIQSVRFTFRNGALLSRSSDSLRSSPPKNGCISTKPIIFSFLNSCRPYLTATWWAMLPPALSPARQQRLRSMLEGSTA